MRYFPADTGETFCIALFGNDGFRKRPDSDPVIHARTKAYVHCLYAGLANLLPEGAVAGKSRRQSLQSQTIANCGGSS